MMLVRVLAPVLALLSLFFFPWPITAALILITAFFMPIVGLLLGITGDILYYMPGAYPVPLFTLIGIGSFFAALLMHRFVKTRIMEA